MLIALAGCASVQNAGTASYSVRPIVIEGKTLCCAVEIQNGKEIALLDATVAKRGEDYDVHLHEEGVAAFKGQAIAAGAAQTLAADAVKAAALGGAVLIAPIAAPALGAALAAPGLGAAAVGAGGALAVQKLAAPPAP